jgi:hypothetical protein
MMAAVGAKRGDAVKYALDWDAIGRRRKRVSDQAQMDLAIALLRDLSGGSLARKTLSGRGAQNAL